MVKMKKTIILIAFAVAFCTAKAQDIRERVSLYGRVGMSFAGGGRMMESLNPARGAHTAAAFALGANYEVERWARLSLGYTYSKYEREKRFSELQENGDCYTDHRMQYHLFDLTAEFNALELWKSCPLKRLSVWFGTGLGLVHAYGFTYNINMGFLETVDPSTSTGDNYELEAWLTAKNTDLRYTSPTIPLTMSINYRIHPQWSISLDGSLRFLLDKKELSPTTLSDIGISARYHFQ